MPSKLLLFPHPTGLPMPAPLNSSILPLLPNRLRIPTISRIPMSLLIKLLIPVSPKTPAMLNRPILLPTRRPILAMHSNLMLPLIKLRFPVMLKIRAIRKTPAILKATPSPALNPVTPRSSRRNPASRS